MVIDCRLFGAGFAAYVLFASTPIVRGNACGRGGREKGGTYMDSQALVEQLVSVNRDRAAFYRGLAYYYLHELSQEQIEALAQSDFSAAGADDPLMAEGYALMEGFLRKVDTGTIGEPILS